MRTAPLQDFCAGVVIIGFTVAVWLWLPVFA